MKVAAHGAVHALVCHIPASPDRLIPMSGSLQPELPGSLSETGSSLRLHRHIHKRALPIDEQERGVF